MKVSMHAARMGMQAHERTQGESAKATPPTWDSGVGNGCCCSLLAARTDEGCCCSLLAARTDDGCCCSLLAARTDDGCCCSLLAARTDDGRMGGEQAGPVPVRDSSGGTGRPAGREAELVVRR